MRRACILLASLVTSACSTVPTLQSQPSASVETPLSLDTLISHLQCEVATAMRELSPLPADAIRGKSKIPAYAVGVILSVDIVDKAGIAPSLALIDPIKAGSTDRSLLLGGQYARTNHRSITRNFTFNVTADSIGSFKDRKCSHGDGLGGDLGLKEAMSLASNENPPLPFVTAKDVAKNFVVAVDFTITKGVSGGPNWNLEHVNGPDQAGDGLVSWKRDAKDSVTLAFSPVEGGVTLPLEPDRVLKELDQVHPETQPVQPLESAKEEENKKNADQAADAALTRTLLQRILPQR